ncbi:LlaJI family restriction endonuclease [Cetobacterium sp. 8H]|uniref:LlaJI family restriction endonuclease n=1 Tax=Cetobacterium sp. 8H TaxID=2759681 RepID=UPI00163CAACD|nr:LlaJI family restriction endonuclease [Cetobacterium sp. 8H]MBC2850008.1 LlaJI family restriction endonuclease [Cetobacterium sp. 8H]
MGVKENFFKCFREFQRFKISDLITNIDINRDCYQVQLEKLLQEKILIQDEDETYYFKFVGTINLIDKLIVIFPKYREYQNLNLTKEDRKYLKQLFEVFEMYNSKSKRVDIFFIETSNEIEEYFSLFSLYKKLIEDYIQNNLYENENIVHELSGTGEIDWMRTVQDIQPNFSKNMQPIYLNYYTYDVEEEQQNYIKLIQKELLSKASEFFRQFEGLDLDIIELDFYFEEEVIGDLAYKINKIDLELREVFSESKIRLLNLMKQILKNLKHNKVNDLNLYGTKNFEKVWENICQNVFGHQPEWLDVIIKPKWREINKDISIETDTFIPDITYIKYFIFYISDIWNKSIRFNRYIFIYFSPFWLYYYI